MPYKNAATIPVRRSTKSKLAEEVKGDDEAWDDMLNRIAESGMIGGDRQ